MDASTELARLKAERGKASARLDTVERNAREAMGAVQARAAELAEVERVGGSARRRTEAEAALGKARQAADQQLWQARIDGARRAVTDAAQAEREHIKAHLAELIQEREAAGEIATERFNAAATELISAGLAREQVASELGALASKVSRVDPHDVTRSAAEELVRATTALVNAGGEVAPRLSRINEPWATLLASEAVSA